jgi:Zn finger protein HypA/HybF involved in hydrogenase expression
MKKDHVPAGSDVSAGTYECTECKSKIKVPSVSSLPPCAKCNNGDWKVISGVGDAKNDPYPDK